LDEKEVKSLCKLVRKPGGPSDKGRAVVSLNAKAHLKLNVSFFWVQDG